MAEPTKKRAMKILITAAAERIRGSGTGISSLPSDSLKQEIMDAIVKLYKDAYGWDPSDSDLFNLGL